MSNEWDQFPAATSMDAALHAEGVTGKTADIARSIYQQESGSGKNTKTSNAGAAGGMQMLPATFKGVADEGWDINNPVHNARAGVRYIQKMSDLAGGDPALTAAGYYGGPGGLEKARNGIAVSDPRNPNAPNTLQYGQQVAARVKSGATASGTVASENWDQFPVAEAPSTQQTKAKPAVSKDYQSGRDAPGWKQGLASVINGPLMGFGDEVLGGLGAMIDKAKNPSSDLGANYRANRDTVRGMQDAQAEENPWTTGITQTMASAPMLVLNPLGKIASGVASVLPQALRATGAAPAVTGMVPNTMRAAGAGLSYGAVQGAGDSRAETLNGVMADAATTGLTSAALSGVASPVAAVLGAGAKNIGQRFSKTQAGEAAKQKISEALSRDARGEVFTSGQSNPIGQVLTRFDRLGNEATLADAGGRNTNQLLDTLATLPGRTKDATEQLIHARQAGRSGRLVAAAEDGLSTQGERLGPNLAQWIEDRQVSSAPLYQQLRQTSITPSSNLQAIVESADELGAVKLGREMATARQQTFSLDAAPSPRNGVTNQPRNQTWTMGDLDHVKQGLDQKIAKQWDAVEGNLPAEMGPAITPNEMGSPGAMAVPGFENVVQTGMAAPQYTSPAFAMQSRADGTLAVTGDKQALREMLTAAGVPVRSMMPINGGVLVGRSQAAMVQEAINQMNSEQPESESVPAEELGMPQNSESNDPSAQAEQASTATEFVVNQQPQEPVQPVAMDQSQDQMQGAELAAAPVQSDAPIDAPDQGGLIPTAPPTNNAFAARIQRLRDSGESKVADMLQRTQSINNAQAELASMRAVSPQLELHGSPIFNDHYQQQRLAGRGPAEASAFAGIMHAVQQVAPALGMPAAAVKALNEKLHEMPIDASPAFVERFAHALAKRGVLKPLDGSNNIASMIENARDAAMHGALNSFYQSDELPSGSVSA